MLSFKPTFSLSFFPPHRGALFSSSSLSVIRVVSPAYLRLLFLPEILIPVCNSSSLAFHMMYSAYKLNKQSDNIQPCHTPFPTFNQFVVPYKVLTVASWPAYKFLRRQVTDVWYWLSDISISKCFLQFVVIHTVKGFIIVNEADGCFFFWIPLPPYDPTNVGNLISGSSAFSKPSLYMWKFSVHVLVKPSLKDFEHNLTSMENEHNCMVVWTFFGTVLLWDWNENWLFPVLWPLLSFPNLPTYASYASAAASFRILNSSAGIYPEVKDHQLPICKIPG